MSDPKSEKPYKLESIPRPWTETDVETWWLTVMDFLKSVTRYKKSMNEDKEWKPKRFPNRGFTGTQAADRSDLIDSILLKIAKNDSEQIHKLQICQECNSKGLWLPKCQKQTRPVLQCQEQLRHQQGRLQQPLLEYERHQD